MIPVEHEKDPPLSPCVQERCCFCRNHTRFWTTIAQRTPGQQVACCPECAASHVARQVPTKHAWCVAERHLSEIPGAIRVRQGTK